MRQSLAAPAATVLRIADQGAAGPCRARNLALRSARTPWVFLLDDDAFPDEGCLDALLAAAAADPGAAIVSPRILRAENPAIVHYDGGRAHFLGELCLENAWFPAAAAAAPGLRPTAVATTALLIHRERALNCGLFDEDMVFFREDLEFSLRVRAHGWTIRHCPSALVRHGRPDGSRGMLHRRRTFYQTRNRWWIILKLFEAKTILATLPAQLAYEVLNFGLALRCGEVRQYAAAFMDLTGRLPAIWAGRKRFQASRRLPDRVLLGAPPLSWTPEVRALPLAPPLKRGLDAACRMLSKALLAAALIVTAVHSASAAQDYLVDGLAEAERMVKTGDYAGATDFVAPLIERAWTERGPMDARVVHAVGARAGWARYAGRPDEVGAALRRLESVRPPTTASLLERARIMRLDGDLAAAGALAEQAAASGGEQAFRELALCREAQGRLEDGVAALRRGLAANPRSPGLRADLAYLLRRTGGYKEALQLLREARELDPGRVVRYFEEGYARLLAGEGVKAEKLFLAAVASSTGTAMSHHHLATSLWFRGRREEALAEAETSRRLHESDPHHDLDEYAHTLVKISVMLRKMGRPGAEELARKAVSVSPQNVMQHYRAYALLADLQMRRGAYEEARATSDLALRQCARNHCAPMLQARLLVGLSDIELGAGDAAAARRAVDRARALLLAPRSEERVSVGHGWARLDLLVNCTRLSRVLGDREGALASLLEAGSLMAAMPAIPVADAYREEREMLALDLKEAASSAAAPADELRCDGCNVILISIDTLRADALGIYGSKRGATPNLDLRAKRGLVFLNAFSQTPNTLSSHMSMFTGLYPWHHGVRVPFKDRLDAATPTLPQLLRERGYRTAWFAPTKDPYLALSAGFERGFDEILDSSSDTWRQAKAWLGTRVNDRFFLFLHTYRVHDPYIPEWNSVRRLDPNADPRRYLSGEALRRDARKAVMADPSVVFSSRTLLEHQEIFRLGDERARWKGILNILEDPSTQHTSFYQIQMRRFYKNFDVAKPADAAYLRLLYDAAASEVDRDVESVLKELESLGLEKKTLVVITSDHGEEFGEHGGRGHGQLYDECLHVPLIFLLPKLRQGRTEAGLARTIDILPTTLAFLGEKPPAARDGDSLIGSTVSAHAFGAWQNRYSVRDARHTCIASVDHSGNAENFELYDRRSDPGEHRNIAADLPEKREECGMMINNLAAEAAKIPPARWPEKVDEKARVRLLKTGYW